MSVNCECGRPKPSGYGECFYCNLRDATIGVEIAGGKQSRIESAMNCFGGGGNSSWSPRQVSPTLKRGTGLPIKDGLVLATVRKTL